MTNAVDHLSQLSGLSRDNVKDIWAEVKANQARLRSHVRHRFPGGPVVMGKRVTCVLCGGSLTSVDAYHYTDGYVAAGGDANDIWPGYSEKA